MAFAKLLIPATLLIVSTSAAAGVTVLGSSSARLCYEATEFRSSETSSLQWCNKALAEEALTSHDRVATHVNRGILKLRMRHLEEAVADFEAATALDPEQPEAYLNKGMALLRSPDRTAEALAMFDAAITHQSQRPALAYYGRAVVHEMSGRIPEAYHDYREASRLEPEWRDPKIELARFTVRQR